MANWQTPMMGTPAQNGNSAAGNSDFSRKAEGLAQGLWGTPRGSDAEKGGPNQSFSGGGTPLPAQAAQWTTPRHSDGQRGGTGITGNMSGSSLTQKVAQWPTPASRDHKGENSPEHLTNGTGRLHMDQLPNAVAHGFTRPDLAIERHGPGLSAIIRIWRPLRTSAIALHGRGTWRRLRKGRNRRRLNPLFVEWLMGWPPGHALCAGSATEWYRWQRDMRGALLQLPTASGPWIWKPPDEDVEYRQLKLL